MKVMPIILFVAFTVISACCSPNKGPEAGYDLKPATETKVLSTSSDKFYVMIEVVAYAKQIAQYPDTWLQVQAAMSEWESKVPVKFTVYIEDPSIINQFGFPVQIFHDRPCIQNILLTNIQSPELGSMQEGIVGLWDPKENRLLLDGDTVESIPNVAFSVALHEIGHMLGVPHIVNLKDRGLSGMIGLPDDIDATKNVMYPQIVDGADQRKLSELEITLARNFLLNSWTNPDKRIIEKCELK